MLDFGTRPEAIKMFKKKLTIIIPIYNVEKYLDQCLETVVGQTYKNLEIILVDDGSTDSSGIKCDEWALQDNRIKVYHT
jgi:glycosyltransferase involved in cell wall biosynthesis